MIRTACLAALLAFVAAAPLDAQLMPASAHTRLQQSLDAQSFTAVTAALSEARAKGLPTTPLVNRALQASLVKASGPRVRDAVVTLAQHLAVAREALGARSSDAELSAGAQALAAKVPRETLQQIRLLSGDRPVTVPLGVVTELVARRVAPSRASQMVVALLRNGATPAQLVSLSDAVQHDVDAGIDANAAFDIRTRGALGTLEQGIAEGDRILTNAPAGPGVATTTKDKPGPPPRAPRRP